MFPILGSMSVSTGAERRSRDVIIYAEAFVSVLLVVMVVLAAVSGLVLAQSIEQDDTGSAKVWVTVFAASSLIAALVFGGLV